MDYRLYVLDESGGIRSRTEFESPNDEAACAHAEAVAQAQRVELWQDRRRIGTFGVSPSVARSA